MDILRYTTFLENEDVLLFNLYNKGRKRLKIERLRYSLIVTLV